MNYSVLIQCECKGHASLKMIYSYKSILHIFRWSEISWHTIDLNCNENVFIVLQRFTSYSHGQLSKVSSQSYFWMPIWGLYSVKRFKLIMWFNTQRIRGFNFDVYFVILNDLDHVISIFLFFDLV